MKSQFRVMEFETLATMTLFRIGTATIPGRYLLNDSGFECVKFNGESELDEDMSDVKCF